MKRSDVSTYAVLSAVRAYELLCNKELKCVAWINELFAEATPLKVAMSAVWREINRGLVDYGTTEYCPWLTPEGRNELNRLEGRDA